MSLLTIFLASLLGSSHCAGMCGGFVAFYSANGTRPITHVYYSAGRFITYIALGTAAGLLGSSIDNVGLLFGLQRAAAVIIGVLMISWGFAHLFGITPVLRLKNRVFRNLIFPFHAALKQSREQGGPKLAFLFGLLTTLLPCGWLYSFVALAAATASPVEGALVMAVFWMGTLPIMTSLGAVSAALTSRMRTYVPRITALLIIIAGFLSISGHLTPMAHNHECAAQESILE
jgi:uncharacterized protein